MLPRVFGNRVIFEMADSNGDVQLYMIGLPE